MSGPFDDWLDGFRVRAGAEDVPGLVALAGVTPLPEVVEKDRAQAEFTLPARDYLARTVTAGRIAAGRAKLAAHAPLFQRITATYGIPAPLLAAIWGVETAFGTNRGSTPTLAALATLAAEGRRRTLFEAELRAFLRLAEREGFDPRTLAGSWAGATGHMQFMPSTALAHAVDLDGDGRPDLWHDDPADALASAAAYLASGGWAADKPCLTRAAWVTGDPSLMAPAGAAGPVFRPGANWRALARYNASDLYGLSVVTLAQALAGDPWSIDWPETDRPLTRETVARLQATLSAQGFAAGAPDGRIGPQTRSGLKSWQRANGLIPDGHPGPEVLARLAPEKQPEK